MQKVIFRNFTQHGLLRGLKTGGKKPGRTPDQTSRSGGFPRQPKGSQHVVFRHPIFQGLADFFFFSRRAAWISRQSLKRLSVLGDRGGRGERLPGLKKIFNPGAGLHDLCQQDGELLFQILRHGQLRFRLLPPCGSRGQPVHHELQLIRIFFAVLVGMLPAGKLSHDSFHLLSQTSGPSLLALSAFRTQSAQSTGPSFLQRAPPLRMHRFNFFLRIRTILPTLRKILGSVG